MEKNYFNLYSNFMYSVQMSIDGGVNLKVWGLTGT